MNNDFKVIAAKLDRLIKILEVIAGIKSTNSYRDKYYPFENRANNKNGENNEK